MRKPKTTQFWTDQELHWLREHYTRPDGIKVLMGLMPHRGYNSIKGMANVNGLTRWVPYIKDREFFNHLNDLNNVIAGFFAADGCITSRDNRFVINLARKDVEHLDRIRQHLGYDGPLTHHTSKGGATVEKNGKTYVIGPAESSILQIADCPEWVVALNRHWNITPRKTNTLQPPNLTNLRHALCYISGLIDGDGWVCLNAKDESIHGKVLEISVMGTKELMEWVKWVFDQITPGQTRSAIKPTSSPNGAVYTVRGTRAYVIAKVLLSLDILRLDRKWQNARDYIVLLESDGGTSGKMARWIVACGLDATLIDRLQSSEIALPAR